MPRKQLASEGEAVVVDFEKCLACRGCELECALAHSGTLDIVEALQSGFPLMPRVKVIAAAGRAVPLQCQHCEEAPCVEVCPSGALYKDEKTGRTLTAVEKCIGCKSCILVCPFGVIEWDSVSHCVVKCDMCESIVEKGQQPVCVSGCPTGARSIRKMADLAAERREKAAVHTVKTLENH